MVGYREFGAERLSGVIGLYEDAGWLAYLGDDAALERAFGASLYVLGAFDGDRLIGLVRCVGDGEHIVYVQDLIVHSQYRRRGIGGELLRAVMSRFAHVRMLALMTDDGDEVSKAFYRAMKLSCFAEGNLVGFFR